MGEIIFIEKKIDIYLNVKGFQYVNDIIVNERLFRMILFFLKMCGGRFIRIMLK